MYTRPTSATETAENQSTFSRVNIISHGGERAGRASLASYNLQSLSHLRFKHHVQEEIISALGSRTEPLPIPAHGSSGASKQRCSTSYLIHRDIHLGLQRNWFANLEHLHHYSFTEFPLQDANKHHMIVPDGYNIGRDLLVQSAISGSSWNGIKWRTDVEWREGLLEPGFKGIVHPAINLYVAHSPPRRNQPRHRARWPYCYLNSSPRHLTAYSFFLDNSNLSWNLQLVYGTVYQYHLDFLYPSTCYLQSPSFCTCIYLVCCLCSLDPLATIHWNGTLLSRESENDAFHSKSDKTAYFIIRSTNHISIMSTTKQKCMD